MPVLEGRWKGFEKMKCWFLLWISGKIEKNKILLSKNWTENRELWIFREYSKNKQIHQKQNLSLSLTEKWEMRSLKFPGKLKNQTNSQENPEKRKLLPKWPENLLTKTTVLPKSNLVTIFNLTLLCYEFLIVSLYLRQFAFS